jgi:hypothetical protein
MGGKGQYAALSHCWGGSQPLRTLTENLDDMKTGIEWICLPNTFQDGITVACRLKILYIWIDSLCIIQDSKEDWEIESSKMWAYYNNAYITISASSSPNSLTPILRQRDTAWLHASFQFQDGEGC